ncbi:MAG: ATP-dependent DNA helicase, partial [Clostridia bacterium]|nr:ATP-dependent DNA helicase [Clostridia bacterium]
MKDKNLTIGLDDILPLLCPTKNGETRRRPTETMRKEALGQNTLWGYPDTPLSLKLGYGEGNLSLEGIAHRILKEGEEYIIEEETLVERSVDFALCRDQALLRAQLLGLALCNTKKLSRVTLRLSVYAEGRAQREEFPFEKDRLSDVLTLHARDMFSLIPLWQKPDTAIEFPHKSLRQGQKKLIRAAWDAICSSSKLYACAPTGIGKTAAVLYPALRALEKGKATQIFYASPKNTLKMQAAATVEALQKLRGLRTIVLSAKMSLCPKHLEECDGMDCTYREGFSEKLPRALSFLTAFSCITEKELLSAAEHFQICPFALAKKMAGFCHVIIGDYNHVFDPTRAVFAPKKDAVLLVDEAHNLPGRIRENNTETLAPSDFDPFFRDTSQPAAMLRDHFGPLLALFPKIEQKRKDSQEYFSFEFQENVAKEAAALLPKVTFALHEGFGLLTEETEQILSKLYTKLKKFVRLCKEYDENFATIYPPEGGIRIYSVDPRAKISQACKSWRSVLFFSATLLPEAYYFDLLAGEEGDEFLSLPSPFPRDNLFVGLCGVDVSHSKRFDTAPKICSIIHSAVSAKEGNYMVFLPSFEYLRLVSQEYKRRFFEHRILIQDRVMTPKKRAAFLEEFRKEPRGTLIGFCVMGGIFSEGVDLKGEALSGEIIVGTGFPPPTPEA